MSNPTDVANIETAQRRWPYLPKLGTLLGGWGVLFTVSVVAMNMRGLRALRVGCVARRAGAALRENLEAHGITDWILE